TLLPTREVSNSRTVPTFALPRSRCSGKVFLRGSYASSHCLFAMALAGKSVQVRKVLHHLQGTGQCPPLHGRSLLLPRLPGSLRRLSCHQPWQLSLKSFTCISMPTRAWPPLPEA